MTTTDYAKVRDAMTPSVRTIGAMATVREAIAEMREAGVSSLVVERRDEADEAGLLTVSDIAREVIARNCSVDRVNVYEIMSKPVLTLPADMNIKYAVRLLVRFSLSRALVVDEHRQPVGIVTLRDLVLRHGAD
ncbi:MAG: CBS domain-containing protein [Alphaproteobacteria bacterium]|nr:MAG: CBS domain-containing protein [Alphaproteobacteria bacterium]